MTYLYLYPYLIIRRKFAEVGELTWVPRSDPHDVSLPLPRSTAPELHEIKPLIRPVFS